MADWSGEEPIELEERRSSERKERKERSSERKESKTTVSFDAFYETYSGHEVRYLAIIYDKLRQLKKGKMIFLAGDSSLDNKYWFHDLATALNGYEDILSPAKMKQDVCYWLNSEIHRRKITDLACLNTAIEATSLNSRSLCTLCDQDIFIRDHISSEDYLVVSVGGNDIALNPLLFTILNIIPLACCTPKICVEKCGVACPPNLHIDCGCLCCGLPGCLSGFFGWPPGLAYFIDLFKNRVQNYVTRLVSRQKPKKVLICMIYYPDECSTGGSWADGPLGVLGYNCCPDRLQLLIRTIFKLGTSKIEIPGTQVVPFALHEVLDGKKTSDYCQRVEPSPQGGSKMARALMDRILETTIKSKDFLSKPTSEYD